jgi:hypothetical protein
VALHGVRPHEASIPSRVATEASPSHVTVGESAIDLAPESGILLRDDDHGTVLTLERGEVSLHVAPREKDRPFLVEAGDVHVRVVGTEFTVRRVGIGAAVSVRKGIVEVREHDELTRLRAGEQWPDASAVIAAPIAPATANAPSVNAPSTPSVAKEDPLPPPPHARSHGAARGATHGRVHEKGGSARAVSSPLSSPPEVAAPIAAIAAPEPVNAVTAPAPVAAPAPAPPASEVAPLPVPEAPSPQARYEAAEQIERSDPGRALKGYLELARGSDAWAQNALYAAGRLQADRGAREDAVRLLEEYLRRFPRGSNAQDARALRESLR